MPLFLFMGYLLERANLMDRLFKAFQIMFGGVKGSLSLATLGVSTISAATTGIVGASVSIMGLMAAPVMRKSGYDTRLSAGSIAAGGTLGILIPPSVMLVVMGPVLQVSTVRLFAASILPGVLLSTLFIAYTMIRSYLHPALRPVLRELLVGVIPPAVLLRLRRSTPRRARLTRPFGRGKSADRLRQSACPMDRHRAARFS